jgi:hypothetical protein
MLVDKGVQAILESFEYGDNNEWTSGHIMVKGY